MQLKYSTNTCLLKKSSNDSPKHVKCAGPTRVVTRKDPCWTLTLFGHIGDFKFNCA